jgi:AcrR family transcriptional regulator
MAREVSTLFPRDLRPRPVQQRAISTVDAVLSATIDLIEQQGEDAVTVQQVLDRSGISSGSLYHHFRDRDGLIAAAQVTRFLRVTEMDEELYRAVVSTDTRTTLLEQAERLAQFALTGDRQRLRWVRISAIVSAHQRPVLHETLSHAMTRLFDAMELHVAAAKKLGEVPDAIDARTLAIYATIYGHALVLDDLDPTATDHQGWLDVQRATFRAIFRPSTPAPEVTSSTDGREASTRRLERARDRLQRLDLPCTDLSLLADGLAPQGSGRRARRPSSLDDQAQLAVSLATDAVLAGRARELTAESVMEATGLSTGGFTRRFGNRAGLLDAARLDIELQREHELLTDFTALVRHSPDHAAFRAGILGWIAGYALETQQQRVPVALELLAASQTDDVVRSSLSSLSQRATDLLIERIVIAQERGLVRSDLTPHGIARLLQGHLIWFAIVRLDTTPPPPAAWAPLLEGLLSGLDPALARTAR